MVVEWRNQAKYLFLQKNCERVRECGGLIDLKWWWSPTTDLLAHVLSDMILHYSTRDAALFQSNLVIVRCESKILISLPARNERKKIVQKCIPVSFLNYDCNFHSNCVLVPARLKIYSHITYWVIALIAQNQTDDRVSFMKPNNLPTLNSFRVGQTIRGTS